MEGGGKTLITNRILTLYLYNLIYCGTPSVILPTWHFLNSHSHSLFPAVVKRHLTFFKILLPYSPYFPVSLFPAHLNWRAREYDPVGGHQLPNGHRRLGPAVLDDVALVQDQVVPLDRAEEVDVVPDN